MQLTQRRNSYNLVDQVRSEMDDLFSRFFGTADGDGGRKPAQRFSALRVDLSETEKAFMIKADIPGVDPKDIDITVRDGVLTLRGEKKAENEEKGKNFHRIERFYGQFFRSVPLPTGVDEENVSAASAKGVLTVTIPKKPEAQPKKVAIKAAAE